MKERGLLSGWLLFFSLSACAQAFWSLEHYTTAEGLPHDMVTAIAKDEQGFMWIGTAQGVARFDGRRFSVFQPLFADSSIIFSPQATGLLALPGGELWISTRGGLYACNTAGRACRQLHIPEMEDATKDNDWASQLVLAGDDAWFLTAGHLGRLDTRQGKCRFFPLPQVQETFFTFTGLAAAANGRLWMVAGYQVFSFDPATGRFSRYPLPALAGEEGEAEAWSILVDGSNTVWCGTRDHGLFRLNPGEGQFEPHAGEGLFVRSLGQAGEELWLGGGGKGLYRLPRGSRNLESFSGIYPGGHNGSWANQFYCDSSLQLAWVGTQKGLEKIDLAHPHFQVQQLPLPASENFPAFVLNIIPDNRAGQAGHYWLKIIGQGLFRWSLADNRLERISGKAIGKANESLAQDGEGRVWINQYGKPKLMVYGPAAGYWLPPPVPEPFLDCSYVYADRRGDIWIGTFSNQVGKYQMESQSFQEVSFFNQLAGQAEETDIVAITEDAQGRVWVITDKSLYCIGPDGQATVQIDLSPLIPEGAFLLSILAASDGQLWLGTREGAFQLDANGKPIRQLYRAGGLPLAFVYQIVEDAQRQIWLGTPGGLYRTGTESGLCRKFDQKDGLLGDNAYFLSSGPPGFVFVGYPSAVNYIDTRRWPEIPVGASLAVAELRVLDQARAYEPGKELTLQPWENFFTIRPALLNYRNAASTTYQYRLKGFEEQWHELGAGGQITYTNLDGGRYTLEVKAAGSQNPGEEYFLSVPLRAIPPFHKTAWFPLLLALLLSAIAGAFWHNRRQQARQLQALRQRIARDLHDDVGSSLSSIRFFAEYIRQSLAGHSPEAAAHLERISQSAAHINENMREIIWALQARPDGLESLACKIREYGARLMESRNIQFSATVAPAFAKQKMDIHRQRNLYLICKEAFNNAAKYADCTKVEWEVDMQPGHRFTLLIRDDGKGFDPASVEPGNGLPSLHKRAAEMGGQMELSSAPGQGTILKLEWAGP